MSLVGAFSTAADGLANVSRQLAVVSQNVANANTAGYARESSSATDLTADGVSIGVRSGVVSRTVDVAAQGLVLTQNATVAGWQTRQAALQSIDALQGTPGQGTDLASLTGKLQDAFSTLATDPSSQTQQQAVVVAAQGLVRQVNTVADGVAQARQTAQDGIVGAVSALNTGLQSIGQLSDQIVRLQADGQSTADLENQRDAATTAVSQLIDAKFLVQPNGDMLAVTSNGLDLPVHASTGPFAVAAATIGGSTSYAAGTVPAITLDGTDVTTRIKGGQLGADIGLRDTTLPTYQAGLDNFAVGLAQRFAAQGLALFTDGAGAVPATGAAAAVGFAQAVTVNPAVAADASLVRDGTTAVAGSATGATAFTPNPSGGPAGFDALTLRILDYSFGANVQDGVAQPALPTTGLGPSGTLSTGFAPPATLAGYAAALVGAQATDSGDATAQLASQQAVQTALGARAASGATVSIDQEMSDMVQLQNAYGANAKVLTAVQSMWTQLLQSVG